MYNSNQEIFPYRATMLKNSEIADYLECRGAVFVRIKDLRKCIVEEMKHPARIESFVILYCAKGSLKFAARLQELEMVENTSFWVAHSMMQFKECSDDCILYAISFSRDFASKMNVDISHIMPLMSAIDTTPKVYSTPPMLATNLERGFNRMLESSLELKGSQVPYADLAIGHLFTSLFYSFCVMLAAEAEDSVQSPVKNRTTEYFERLMQLLSEHYKTERSVEFYADKMSLTPKHLSRVVRSHSGRSVHQWIDAFVVQEIKNLLKHSNLSIQQISYELQFSNPSFMGQYFKRITGKTPGEYRREL